MDAISWDQVRVDGLGEMCTWDLKDAARALRVVDEERVCGIIHNDAAVLLGKVDQLSQLLPGGGCPSRVVGRAEEDEICAADLQTAKLMGLYP